MDFNSITEKSHSKNKLEWLLYYKSILLKLKLESR